MFETYLRLYKHYVTHYGQNTAIFLLVGSFYELYDIREKGEGQTSFDRATTILGIQRVPKGEGLWSAGFKDISLHKFATMLTRENWTVVVVDQVKDERGAVSSRDVARILSPGTHIENTGADSFYTGGLWLQGEWNSATLRFAAAAVDLTTGALHTYEGEATGQAEWSSDSLLHFFQVHQPKELVVWWRGHSLDQPQEIFLRRTLGIPTALIHVRSVLDQGALEKPIVREDLLQRCFKPKSLLPLRASLGISDLPLTERALASLLLFVEDHYSAAIDMLRLPIVWSPENSVYLGNHALTQLNMITAREEDSVLGIFMKTYTPMGRRAMRRRLLYPITHPKTLNTLYSEIDWCMDLGPGPKEAVLGNLRQIGDLSRLHRRLTVGTVNAADVTSLDMSYTYSTRILTDMGEGPLSTFRRHSDRLAEAREAFAAVFDIEKALKPQDDMFCLTAVAGPRTAAVEAEIAAARTSIESIHQEIAVWVGIERGAFRLEEKEASIVVAASKTVIKEVERALKAGQAPASLKGIQVHAKKSSSSLEIPGLNAQYTRILGLRRSLAAAVKEELPAACDTLTPYMDVWDELEAWISKVDMSFTLARVSKERGFVRPQLAEGAAASLSIKGLRHPLIEAQQTRTEYVKHDMELGNKAAGWLVYGMNASGKSSLMKAVGIATILAQTGCFVPATSFSYTPFKSLFTRILNTDNLWAGLSSFAIEMTELAEILRRANPWSLVLGDEVCSGTESMSAMSLVGASLEHLSKRGARFIFATHLHGLQEIPAVASLPLKVWHLQVRFDPKTQRLIYDRTLHPGAGSSLYGLEVAKAMAIPLEVLESAHAIRKALVGSATEQEAPLSDWNGAVQRRACAVCGSEKVRDLEAHHIEARATAAAGRLADGSNMNDMRNLTVLCEVCHDKVHAGTLKVGPTKQTSEGPVLDVKDLAAFAFKPKPMGGLTEEQLELIKNDLRTYRTLTPARLIFYIEQHHGIKLTLQRLKTIRASL